MPKVFPIFFLAVCISAEAQVFKKIPLDSLGVRVYEVLCSKEGAVKIVSSAGFWGLKGNHLAAPSRILDRSAMKWKYFRDFNAEDGIRAVTEANDSLIFYATWDNMILWYSSQYTGVGVGFPPFLFPPEDMKGNIVSLWTDSQDNLFIGTTENFYFIKEGAYKWKWDYKLDVTQDSNLIITKGSKRIQKINLAPQTTVHCFAQDSMDRNKVWVGTNKGVYQFNQGTGETKRLTPADAGITVTALSAEKAGNLWFSTMEKGMAYFDSRANNVTYYPCNKEADTAITCSIKTFCAKSRNEFFVAVADSLPAVFHKQKKVYQFITDSVFRHSANSTTDIELDHLGNLYVVKGSALFVAKTSESSELALDYLPDSSQMAPFIRGIDLLNGKQIASTEYNPERLKLLELNHNQNSFIVYYDVFDFAEKEDIQFAWKLPGYVNEWVVMPRLSLDSSNIAVIGNLKPGKYLLQIKVKVGKEDWRKQLAELPIVIHPPYWQTWWFWALMIAVLALVMFVIVKLRVRSVRLSERERSRHEKELLELEARALRAQMNPHFIFNCLNSIKALIQNHENQRSIDYLATFSKLIRTLFHNSDKRQISLHDEVETCKLYTELEAMRLNGKLRYRFDVAPHLDLKSVMVPALIVQPFIENAIWHGIVPKESGGSVTISVKSNDEAIICEVDDDGIGRELSKRNKPANSLVHESKGVHLSQRRLNLEKMLNEPHASVHIIDKVEGGIATGTKVVLKFNLQ